MRFRLFTSKTGYWPSITTVLTPCVGNPPGMYWKLSLYGMRCVNYLTGLSMKTILFFSILFLSMVVFSASTLSAEVVELINGQQMEGEIVREHPDYIVLKTRQNGKIIRPIIHRKLIKNIYLNQEQAHKAIPAIKKPRPSIEQAVEQAARNHINSLLKAKDLSERKKKSYSTFAQSIDLIPDTQIISRWLEHPKGL